MMDTGHLGDRQSSSKFIIDLIHFLKQYWLYYLLSACILLFLKYFYSQADSNDLIWILTPTAKWAGVLGGISFTWLPGHGYVNHDLRFIIAGSCSGVQFLIIAAATLIYSFMYRMKTHLYRLVWIPASLSIAFLYTVFVNGLRIILSIQLPHLIEKAGYSSFPWLTSERLHTIIGILIYFLALLVLYRLTACILKKLQNTSSFQKVQSDVMKEKTYGSASFIGDTYFLRHLCRCFEQSAPPAFWYFSIALGIPFLNRAYINNAKNFMEYSLLVIGISLIIIILYSLLSFMLKSKV